MNILIIEDDIILARNLKLVFEKKAISNRIKLLNSYEQFIDELCIIKSYDIILVDIVLGINNKKNGIDIINVIRSKYLNIPIVIISGFSEIDRLERGFDSGANDYLIKPFRLKEIEIRILKWFKTYLSSLNLNNEKLIEYRNLIYKFEENEFYYKLKKIELTKKSKYLLLIFISMPEKIITEKFLIEKIRGDIDFLVSRNLRVNVLRLKKSLSPFGIGDWIINRRGEGYVLNGKKI